MFQNDFMGTVSLSVDEVKDASKVNLLFSLYLFVFIIGNSMICSDICHQYHE